MRNQQGVILLVVLLWFAVITITMIAVTASSREQAILLQAHSKSVKAFYLAEQGLACARSTLGFSLSTSCRHVEGVHYDIAQLYFTEIPSSVYQVTVRARVGRATAVLQAVYEVIQAGDVRQLSWQQLNG